MQHPKNHESSTRKPWYERAIGMGSLWRSISSRNGEQVGRPSCSSSSSSDSNNKSKLRKCTSLKVATSFTRVCLCAPISSYKEVFRAEVPPRRSNSFPRAPAPPKPTQPMPMPSTEARRVFRGKSLTDDVLMRRFVIEEEAMLQIRRRNQMEVIRSRSLVMRRRHKLGPSPLRTMVLAHPQTT